MRWLALALWLASGFALAQKASDVVDRVAAVVGARVITQSEVDLTAQIQFVKLGRYQGLSLSRTPEIRAKALEYLVVQAVVYEEARRLAFHRIRMEEVTKELASFKAMFPSPDAYRSFLSAHDITEQDLTEVLRRTLVSNRFAEESIRVNVAQVTEAQVEEYRARYGEARVFAGKTVEQVREMIRRILHKQRYDRAWTQWIRELRQRQRVQVLVSYKP